MFSQDLKSCAVIPNDLVSWLAIETQARLKKPIHQFGLYLTLILGKKNSNIQDLQKNGSISK